MIVSIWLSKLQGRGSLEGRLLPGRFLASNVVDHRLKRRVLSLQATVIIASDHDSSRLTLRQPPPKRGFLGGIPASPGRTLHRTQQYRTALTRLQGKALPWRRSLACFNSHSAPSATISRLKRRLGWCGFMANRIRALTVRRRGISRGLWFPLIEGGNTAAGKLFDERLEAYASDSRLGKRAKRFISAIHILLRERFFILGILL